MSTVLRQTLLAELHRAIDDAAREGVAMLQSNGMEPAYPPGVKLSDKEMAALAALNLSADQRSALRKVLRDVASRPLFRLLSLIDGVADPSEWEGVWLGARIEESTDDSSDGAMWHDDFYESYWDYEKDRAADV